MKITVKLLKSLTEKDHKRVLREAGGIVGRVRNGQKGITVNFRFEFSQKGKKQDLCLGTWPSVTPTHIRRKRDQARFYISNGVNPIEAIKYEKIKIQQEIHNTLQEYEAQKRQERTVQELYHSWITEPNGVNRKHNNQALKQHFQRHILPYIGHLQLSTITDADILTMLHKIKQSATNKTCPQKALNRTAQIAYNDTKQMFAWAERRIQWRSHFNQGNPFNYLSYQEFYDRIIDEGFQKIRDRYLTENEIKQLHYQLQERPTIKPISTKHQCALWICLGTLCRIGELLLAQWQHIDFENKIWHIPAANTKGKKHHKKDHNIALSDFTIAYFKTLHSKTGDNQYCFPSRNKTTALSALVQQVATIIITIMKKKK